jgi:hypothetical protein
MTSHTPHWPGIAMDFQVNLLLRAARDGIADASVAEIAAPCSTAVRALLRLARPHLRDAGTENRATSVETGSQFETKELSLKPKSEDLR